MTLIELLVVITILGILIAVLVPKIGGTQEKTRDITRQTQVQELSAALMSYKQDFGEFPIITGEHVSNGITESNQYRGDISLLNGSLKAGGYIAKIYKDPGDISLSHEENFYYSSSGYYIYVSDGKSFMIITPVENEKNGNCTSDMGVVINKLKSESYDNIFNINNTSDTGFLYIYKYEEEIL